MEARTPKGVAGLAGDNSGRAGLVPASPPERWRASPAAPGPPLVALPVLLPLRVVIAVGGRVIPAAAVSVENRHPEVVVALVAEVEAEPSEIGRAHV